MISRKQQWETTAANYDLLEPTPFVKLIHTREYHIPTGKEWAEEYAHWRNNPPIADDYLRTEDGSPVRVEVQLEPGRPPFMFTRAYLPNIVGSTLSWYVQGTKAVCPSGWKCIILPKSREQLAKRGALKDQFCFIVKELVVRGYSRSGNAIMVEVSEWL